MTAKVENLTNSKQRRMSSAAQQAEEQVFLVALDKLEPGPYQPRLTFDDQQLQEMATSIRRDGVLQPVILTRKDDRYSIVAGERRVRAARLAGLKSVPAIIKDLSAADMLRVALIENVQRSDLNAIEEATAYQVLINDFGLTQEQCANQIGKDRSSISNALRLLNLPLEIKTDLMQRRLSMGHCRALLSLPSTVMMLEARQLILKKNLSVRQTELLCRSMPSKNKKNTSDMAELDYLAEGLRTHLQTRVRVSGSGSKGRIEISYFSAAELDRILNLMGCSNQEEQHDI